MATIPSANNQLRHVRKTITFTGGAGAGLLGDYVAAFTTTGVIRLESISARVTTALTCAAPTVTLFAFRAGDASTSLSAVIPLTGSGTVDNFYNDDVGEFYAVGGIGGAIYPQHTARDIGFAILDGGGGANVTGGVVVLEAWYYAESDDGALAGDDIDAGFTPVDVKAWLGTAAATPTVAGVPEVDVTHWLGTAAATPTVAGVPEVDVTHNAGTAITSASGIQEVKVASIAAAAITAAAIATDAIDADALAADAVTEIWAKAMSDLAAVPGATDSVLAGINWLFELARNKRTQSATTETIYKDDGTTSLATSTKSDSSGTFTRGEYS